MMFDSKTPLKYWVEAFFTAVFLSNLLPTTSLSNNKTPYQMLFEKPVNYSFLRTFGCACYPSPRAYASNKFDPRSLKCVMTNTRDIGVCTHQQDESISQDTFCSMRQTFRFRMSTRKAIRQCLLHYSRHVS